MTFDNLISLLLFIFFIVIPIISRLNRSNRPQQQPNPNQPGGGQRPREAAQPVRPLVTAEDAPRQPTGDFAKRLEEARRRVMEAQQQATSSEAQLLPESRPSQPAPLRDAAQRLESQERTAAAKPLRRRAVSQPRAATAGASDTLKTAQPPLRVMRRAPHRLTQHDKLMIRSTANDIRRGFIWHFILEDPKAKQLTRRRLSQRPSR
jgi:hypothetical protein